MNFASAEVGLVARTAGEHPGHEGPLRVGGGLLRGDRPLVDQRLDERVVAGDLGELALPQHVRARIPDVGDRHLVAGPEQRGDGRAHPGQGGAFRDEAAEFVVRVLEGPGEFVTSLVAAMRLVIELDEVPDDRRARDVPAGVAAHPVGNDEQVRTGIRRVLVLRTDQSDIGPGGVMEGERHGLSLEFEGSAADTHRRAELDDGGFPDPLVLDEGAVRRAEILDRPAGLRAEDSGMTPGGKVVIDDEQTLGATADEKVAITERQAGPGQLPRGDDKAVADWGAAVTSARPGVGLGSGDGAPRGGRARRHPVDDAGAVKVAAQHRDETDDKEPQDEEKSQFEDRQGEFTHRALLTGARRGRPWWSAQ